MSKETFEKAGSPLCDNCGAAIVDGQCPSCRLSADKRYADTLSAQTHALKQDVKEAFGSAKKAVWELFGKEKE